MFCTKCGAPVSGGFCGACGTPAQPQAAPPPAMPPGATNVPPPPAARKKTSPLVWVLVGIMVFFLLIGALVVAGGFFLYHKAKQAGFDPDLLQRHPEVAAVKMMVAANPKAELVSVDEDRGIVTVRDKETGKELTFNFEDLKHGRVSLSSGKDALTLQGNANALEVKSSEGSLRLGAGPVKLPEWLPNYPGAAAAEGAYSVEAKQGQAAAVHFTTADSPQQVLDFYEAALKKAGLKTQTVQQDNGGVITAEEDSGQRKASVLVTADGNKTQIGLTFESK